MSEERSELVEEFCAGCRCFRQLKDPKEVIGQCRHHAPKPAHSSREGARDKARIFAEWPVVFGDDWCRKFERAKPATAAVPDAA